jgi:type IV pilus assembly protein PilW
MNRSPSPYRELRHQPLQRQKGFSLIELMVALTLGLLIVGGVISIFITNQQAFRTTEALGRVQENARIAFELMARDVRQSGGNPCGTPLIKNLLKPPTPPTPPPWEYHWADGALEGFPGTPGSATIKAFGTAAAERVENTDAVKVLGSAIGTASGINLHDEIAATIQLATPNSGIKKDDVVMACDGISAAIVQVSSVTTDISTKIETLGFDTTGTTPGNCVTGFSITSTCATSISRELKSDGFVAPLSASFWYIGHNDRNGGKSLYRVGSNGAEEIAENVVDMKIDYLLRTEATRTLETDWKTASDINAGGTPAWNSTTKKVVALRFTLTLQTTELLGTNQTAITRKLFHVVNLRNRAD